MKVEKTTARLWKRLLPEERLAAATAFWQDPPTEVVGSAHAAIIKARKLRPQVARSLGPEERARALAGVLEPGELLASALLVALHLGHRRPMLCAYLDALGLTHVDGILQEEGALPPISDEELRRGVLALSGTYPEHEVHVYLNTLWLQDPDRWKGAPALLEQGSAA